MPDMAEAGIAVGLSEMCFTDHFDLLDFSGHLCLTHDWAPARAQFALAQGQAGNRIRLKYGLELGGAPTDFAAAERVLAEPLDFVIASVHNLDLSAGGTDFYEVNYDALSLCRAHIDNYLSTLEAISLWDGYDVLGHIPYLLRYMRDRDGQPVRLEDWSAQLRTILSNAIARGKGMELNTNRGASLSDYLWLIDLYRELGGEIITVGTDAHRPQDVGKGVPAAYEMLRNAGFRYITTFEGRKPRFIPI
jgi:histidinol-phosphatase (PHP family)